MRMLITVLITFLLFTGVLAVTGQDIVDLSTLNKKPTSVTPINLDVKSKGSPTSNMEVLDLSTLNKKPVVSNANVVSITGPSPTTITPMFAIRNANITVSEPGAVYTLPFAIRNANLSAGEPDTIYTLPIAIGYNNETD